MYSVSVLFGSGSASWIFMFKSKEAAEAARDLVLTGNEELASIADDFGQCAHFRPESMTGILVEDMSATAEASIARGLHQAKMQARANDLANADPALLAAAARQRGGGILQPGPFPRA